MHLVNRAAILHVVRPIVYIVVWAYEADSSHPIPGFLGPSGVGGFASVAGKAGGELEVGGIRDGGFVVEAFVFGVKLPFEAASALGGVPAAGYIFEDVGGERDPRRRGRRGGEVVFGGSHGGETPLEVMDVSGYSPNRQYKKFQNTGKEPKRLKACFAGPHLDWD